MQKKTPVIQTRPMSHDKLMFESNIASKIPTEEYACIQPLFEALNATARLTNASMFVIDFAKNQLVYHTKNLLFLDEASQKSPIRESQNPYWELVSEEDFQVMIDTRDAYLKLFETLSMEQRLNHTYIIDYHINLGDNSMVVSQKFTPLKLTDNGHLWMGLFCVKTSPHNLCRHIAVFGDKFRYVYDHDKGLFVPFKERMELSKKETAILLRVAKGFTTEQIAAELNSSVNTIKTHKSRLFRKLHVNSSNEAITFVQNYKLY